MIPRVGLVLALLVASAVADLYLHNPRGSNNRLHEQSANRNNANRLFDSQNNNRGGYNVGVRGEGQGGNNKNVVDLSKDGVTDANDLSEMYTKTKPTADGTIYPMVFIEGSTLNMEWTTQHGCGGNEATDPHKTHCNMVVQYMCDTQDTAYNGDKALKVYLRDGENTNTPTEPNSATDTNDNSGRHESAAYYFECKTRQRNSGLFLADQKLNGQTARFTRQNPGGTRRGLECPEERDYYPYWHPSPWRDVAYLHDRFSPDITGTARDSWCSWIKSQSMNKATRYKCTDAAYATNKIAANNEGACGFVGGTWAGFSHNIADPYCGPTEWSRQNHLGNGRNGQFVGYKWTLPLVADLKASGVKTYGNDDMVRCVVRVRYNMTSDDYNPDTTNSTQNENLAKGIFSPIEENPTVDIGADLQGFKLAINTAQTGRTFQDRSHVFFIRKRPANLPAGPILNLNIRGKRGNIVQTFPAIEYDFTPNDLTVAKGTILHIQWTGSNTHNNGHDAGDGQAGDAGEGRGGTDRNNFVGMRAQNENFPLPNLAMGTVNPANILAGANSQCFKSNYNAATSTNSADTMVDHECQIALATSGYYWSVTDVQNSNNADLDVTLNNAEPSLVNGIFLQVNKPGTYYYACTRNNNFSNRSQKGMLTVQ